MGEENGLPIVEESTAPPICAEPSGNHDGPSTAGQHSPYDASNGSGKEPMLLKVPHTLTSSQVAEALGVDIDTGLNSSEAASRRQLHGPNKVKGAQGLSLWEILLRQVSNSLTMVLLITMGLSFGIDDYIEGGVITAVIVLNIFVGFGQDYKAEKTIQSLYELTAPKSNVLRNGILTEIDATDLVPGDIVHLKVGDIIPADLRLVDGMNASADEALLTGESLPVTKTPSITFVDKTIPAGDRTNMAYSATTMKVGRATGIVVSTGMRTEVGKIAEMLRNKDETLESSNWLVRFAKKITRGVKNVLGLVGTPLQVTLSKFALLLFGLAIMLAIIVFSANKWQVGGEVLIYGICVAVAVIPESLIAVLTITIAVGAKAMAKGHVLTRITSAMEAIGGVTNICSDKTGTLTQGKMIVRKAAISGKGTFTVHDTIGPFDPTSGDVRLDNELLDLGDFTPDSQTSTFLHAIALCNLSTIYKEAGEGILDLNEARSREASTTNVISYKEPEKDGATQELSLTRSTTISSQNGVLVEWKAHGEPTEIALQVLAHRFGMGKPALLERLSLQHAVEFPFDSSIKRMTVVYKNNQAGYLEAFTKGAVDVLLPLLNASTDEKILINKTAEAWATDGVRVICVAHKVMPLNTAISDRVVVERGLRYIGLAGLHDPPRLETPGAVRECQVAGITVHMVTGDHPATAMAIAREVGILNTIAPNAGAGKTVMTASEFDQMADAELDAMETLPLVIARCSPATKVKMVEALHRRRAFCVMTGDGVNDAPALKRANVGIAMKTGADVAQDAAEMVLADDNFASIVKAVEEGRRLFDNIQKFLMHLLISNIAQVILLLIGLAFKDRDNHSVFPLSPIEILWVNLITSSFLAIGLGLEEAQQDIMFRPPHSLQVGVFTRELIVDKFIYGFFMGSLCLASFSLVAYVGPGGGNLGSNCNEEWNETCDTVFRARATTYATITLLLLVTAWEVKHFSRSLFNLYPNYDGSRTLSFFPTVWRNRFLFWAVIAGFTIMFPIIYLPVINKQVFKHEPISWEWGVSLGCVIVYITAIESWKAIKRRFGIASGKNKVLTKQDAEMRAGLGMETVERKK